MKPERIPLARPSIDDSDIAAVRAVLESGRLSAGPALAAFESSFAEYLGVPGAVGVSSGTAALMLVMDALGVRAGDEVITPSLTFAATANAIVRLGAQPVFVDVAADDLNMDPARLSGAISPRTRAIIVVHLFGRMADTGAIVAAAGERNIAVVEDACEALGARNRAGPAGTLGAAAVFSFYANKPITTAEGGMIASRDDELLRRCRRLRNQGRDDDGAFVEAIAGFSFRLSELHAALGVSQLRRLPRMLDEREKVACRYDTVLRDVDGLELPPLSTGSEQHAWFTYPVRLTPRLADRRAEIRRDLLDAGIETGNYFPPVHDLPFYRELPASTRACLTTTEAESRRLLALPLYAGMSNAEVDRVAAQLRNALDDRRR